VLRSEDAQKRLKTVQIKDWPASRLRELKKLPDKLAAIGRGLLERDAAGHPIKDWKKRRAAVADANKAMHKLPARDRERLFAAFWPKLARNVEAAWQLCARLPYEVGYERRGFRAPDEPGLAATAREAWFRRLLNELDGYDPDVTWVAAWAPYLGHGGSDAVGVLLAAAIDTGGPDGEAVYNVLTESARGEHEVGAMGRHVTRALLVCSKPEAWEFVEKVLLAAQRQEGLRQVILETIDEAHPQAFRRMVRLILDNNLLRFSATVRAVDVWFGLNWDALTPAKLRDALTHFVTYLDDAAARAEALKKATGEPLYLALWAASFEDAPAGVPAAAALLADKKVERRFVAARFLEQLDLPAARKALVPAIDDADLRVALTALEAITSEEDEAKKLGLFEPIKRLLPRMPEHGVNLPELVWPWAEVDANVHDVADHLADYRGDRPLAELIPFLKQMSSWRRGRLLEELAKGKHIDGPVRQLLFDCLAERDDWVRRRALEALKKATISEAEAEKVEVLLARKGGPRHEALNLLKKQPLTAVLASADRLLASKKAPQRLAGLELLRQLVESKKGVAACRERAEKYQTTRKAVDEHEQLQLDAILDIKRVVPTLDDALGLLDRSKMTPPTPPQDRKALLMTPAAVELLTALDNLVAKHAETPIRLPDRDEDDPEELLLGNVGWRFPSPAWDANLETERQRLPLREVWEKFFAERPKKTRDKDGFEALRAMVLLDIDEDDVETWRDEAKKRRWLKPINEALLAGQKQPDLKYHPIVIDLVRWLIRLNPPPGLVDFLLDATETSFALVPANQVGWLPGPKDDDEPWRELSQFQQWQGEATQYFQHRRHVIPWSPEQVARLYRLLRWRDEPAPGLPRDRADFDLVLHAYEGGAATESDILDHMLGPRENTYWRAFHALQTMTSRRPPEICAQRPELAALAERCRQRVLQVELARGELETAATDAARNLGAVFGLDLLFQLMTLLGKKPFDRRTYGDSRATVLSRLIRVCFPQEADTPDAFVARARAAVKAEQLTEERLLELAFFAPQWLPHVSRYFGWQGFEEGVWWFLAHMPGGREGVVEDDTPGPDDDDFDDDDEDGAPRRLSAWDRILQGRSTLTEEERDEGQVDVGWFHRTFELVGKKRWERLAAAAKFGCDDQSHRKAILLADVLRGKASRRELIAQVRNVRLRESARLLGLLPLARADKREADLTQRYKILQEYRRYARSLSPMSRDDAVRAAEVALENLARTAGYPDRTRLEWAMDAREIADLAAGPVSVTADGVTVTLTLDDQAQPEVSVRRGDKPLKAIPPKVRKVPKVAELTERKADLRRQASRMRYSLEAMMVRGDVFTGKELVQILAHPQLRPLLSRLVLLGEKGRGFPTPEGRALTDQREKARPIGPEEKLRVAHPFDFLAAGDWSEWQAYCFRTERVQPFKQVFRETYVVTQAERTAGTTSTRYAGHQVNPAQSMALFGARGWSTRDDVTKTFHDAGLIAEVSFRYGGYTPLEVEGRTLEGVSFRRRGDWQELPLEQVPPRLFSEVMRDLDLVVSVAHVGGVDPEASASTVEMRAALLRETCALVGIRNYEVKANHVLIDGKLGKYSVHLGSSSVHRLPGGSVCIIAVPAQHRGRLFLPFADDDPRTAEVLSKVLLLARDHEIQDPTILQQLR
jgi:hypothetical protein